MNSVKLSLLDFEITGPAEVGACGNAGSFRAKHRQSERLVLLHRFRPAEILLKNNPIINSPEMPDFTTPFMTGFTHLIKAAGSVYLVEPLPVAASLIDVWRTVLNQTPGRAIGVLEIMMKHIFDVLGILPENPNIL